MSARNATQTVDGNNDLSPTEAAIAAGTLTPDSNTAALIAEEYDARGPQEPMEDYVLVGMTQWMHKDALAALEAQIDAEIAAEEAWDYEELVRACENEFSYHIVSELDTMWYVMSEAGQLYWLDCWC